MTAPGPTSPPQARMQVELCPIELSVVPGVGFLPPKLTAAPFPIREIPPRVLGMSVSAIDGLPLEWDSSCHADSEAVSFRTRLQIRYSSSRST